MFFLVPYQAAFLNVFGNAFEHATGMLLKVKGGWDVIDLFRKGNNFMSLLRNIWIKAHFPLESLFRDFG